MKKAAPDLPHFLVLHTADELFLLCFEINGAFQCWASTHPPSMDVRFKRSIRKAANQPMSAMDKPRKGMKEWDSGTYAVGKHKTKKDNEKAFLEGLSENKLSFLLNGNRVKGRFIIHYSETANALLLYKKKDKFQQEEDPLETELKRSMNKWVPKYDPDKVRPGVEKKENKPLAQREEGRAATHKKKAASPSRRKPSAGKEKERQPMPASPLKKLSDGKFTYVIKAKEYEFSLYKALESKDEDLVCLVAGKDTDIFVMRPSKKNRWEVITSVGIAIARNEDAFANAILEFLNG